MLDHILMLVAVVVGEVEIKWGKKGASVDGLLLICRIFTLVQ